MSSSFSAIYLQHTGFLFFSLAFLVLNILRDCPKTDKAFPTSNYRHESLLDNRTLKGQRIGSGKKITANNFAIEIADCNPYENFHAISFRASFLALNSAYTAVKK